MALSRIVSLKKIKKWSTGKLTIYGINVRIASNDPLTFQKFMDRFPSHMVSSNVRNRRIDAKYYFVINNKIRLSFFIPSENVFLGTLPADFNMSQGDVNEMYMICDGRSRELLVVGRSFENVLFDLKDNIFLDFVDQVLEEKGYFRIHASAVHFMDKGILFCGGTGAGKTSLALKFLEKGASLLGSDKVYVRTDSEEPKVYQYPGDCCIKLGTIMSSDRLREELLTKDEIERYLCLSPRERWHYGRSVDKIFTPSKIFSKASFSLLSKLELIVFPFINPSSKSIETRKINKRVAIEKLHSALGVSNFFRVSQFSPREHYEKIVQVASSLSKIPCLDLSLGLDIDEAVEYLIKEHL